VIPNYSILKDSIARIIFFKYPGYPGDSISKNFVTTNTERMPLNMITDNVIGQLM
jgi:hypothetical protein